MSEPTVVSIECDTTICRLSAIKKAAYKFGDRCHIEITSISENRILVALRPKRTLENAQFLAGEFRNELLDQELREVVAQETAGIRNLLLAQAFSATSLLDVHGEQGNEQTDPLNIRAPDSKTGNAV